MKIQLYKYLHEYDGSHSLKFVQLASKFMYVFFKCSNIARAQSKPNSSRNLDIVYSEIIAEKCICICLESYYRTQTFGLVPRMGEH